MNPLALDGNAKLICSIVIGMMVGVWLIKSGLEQRRRFVDMLLLKDGLMLKIFLLSIVFGTVLFYIGNRVGYERLNVRPAYFWASLAGGVIAGVGVTLCGRVPMTAVASLATGKLPALWVLLGFLLAFPAVRWMADFLSKTVYTWSQPMYVRDGFEGSKLSESAVLWTVGVALVLTFIILFVLGGKDKQD